MEQLEQGKISESNQVEFLSDQPLTPDKEREIRFGHLGIAENLSRIILACPTPFTIGLFGKWGTGKTTILNVIREKLHSYKIPVINFDVWKHEGDSLRRTFLKEAIKQLTQQKYLLDFELSERLDTHILRTFQGGFSFNKPRIGILVFIIVAIAATGLLIGLFWPQYLGSYLSTLLGGSFVATLLVWLLQQAMTTEMITMATDRLQDPHEFEVEFEKVISEISQRKQGKLSSERLLVIIDNIDRASHKKAVELLSTIKTFLEKEGCVFLLACDDKAIKKHLESVYTPSAETAKGDTPFDADEFLRKFFNTFLVIPNFIDTELQTYTENLLTKTNVGQLDSTDVAYVITSAFRNNPRQIKQFINTLLAHFLLAQERESGSKPLLAPKAITGNVSFLAKFLVIRQHFTEEFETFCKSYLTTAKGVKDEDTKDDKFQNFLRATKLITTKDIRPFLYLKLSEEELIIPGANELEVALLDNNMELVEEKIKAIKQDPEQTTSFNRLILSLIDRNRGRYIPLSNIVSSSLVALQRQSLELNTPFYNKIADLFNDDMELGAQLENFEPSLVFSEVLGRCNERDKDDIIGQYVGLLRTLEEGEKTESLSTDYARTLLDELVKHKNWLGIRKDEVSKALADGHYTYEILSIFKGRPDDQKDFVSEEVIAKFVSTFSVDDIEVKQNIKNKTGLLLDFRQNITTSSLQAIVAKLNELLTEENQKPYREEKENFLTCGEDIIDTFQDKITNIADPNVLDAFAGAILQGVNQVADWTQKKAFIPTCLLLVDMVSEETRKSNINETVRTFFGNADTESIKFVFDKLGKSMKKEELIDRYSDVFQPRAQRDQNIFDLLYSLALIDTRAQWLTSLIDSAHQRALTKLEELGYKVDDNKRVVGALLAKVQKVPVQERENFYNAVNKMRCANDAGLRSELAYQIKAALKTEDIGYQQVGFSTLERATYLSETLKREVSREIVDWLRTLQPDSSGQPYSVRSIPVNWDILPKPLQRDFLDFTFDKLIKRGVSIDNVRLGFEVLYGVTPKPKFEDEDYSAYFDDILARAESESDAQTKSELAEGLLRLKPTQVNRRNKDFWEKVEELKP